MTWSELSPPWRAAFEQAWGAYCAGSLPIGCAIADRNDNLIMVGRNRLHEGEAESGLLAGNHLAHAEMNALAPLRPDEINARECILYTTMEPCPMCTGAIRMIGVGAIHYAARDPLAGSISLLEATPFMRRSGITVAGPGTENMETFSVATNVAAFLEMYPGTNLPVRLMSEYQTILPDVVRLGQLIYNTGTLQRLRSASHPVDEVYRSVLGQFRPTA